mgnify:CR=1 FL=1
MYPFYYHNMKNNRERGGSAVSLTSLIGPFIVVFGGVTLLGSCQMALKQKTIDEKNPSTSFNESESETREFLPGEHIISVVIDSPLDNAKQYKYHPGYKPVGIATATHGKYDSSDSGSCILYVNDYTVEAKSTGIKDNEPFFGEFGIPTDYVQTETVESDTIIQFAPGEHILSIPIDDPTDFNVQYTFHEGYEPIGIATASYGQYDDESAGSCILYVNSENVEFEKQDDNVYVEFGKVKEEPKTLTKKNTMN